MPLVNVRLRRLDGATETLPTLELGDEADHRGQQLQKLDSDGWWRSFRPTGEIDGEGFSVFEEDPDFQKIKNTLPRHLEGTVFDESGAPLASADVALVTAAEILGQGRTDERGQFRLPVETTKDRVSHDYAITKDGASYHLFDASVLRESADVKAVELRVRR